MLDRFLPKTVPFFELLQEQNSVLRTTAEHLVKVMDSSCEPEEHLKQINLLEERADNLSRDISWHLSQTFITPIDREDIYALNIAQERVENSLKTLAGRIFSCGFMYNRFPAFKMVRSLDSLLEETTNMLVCLTQKREVSTHFRNFKDKKTECEMLLAVGLAELQDVEIISFAMVRDILLWSQIYERLALTIEHLSELADTLEQVVLKYV